MKQQQQQQQQHVSPPSGGKGGGKGKKLSLTPATASSSRASAASSVASFSPATRGTTGSSTDDVDHDNKNNTNDNNRREITMTATTPSFSRQSSIATSTSTSSQSLRLPMPSPSRPRLHPRYAARLAPTGNRSALFRSSSSSSLSSSPRRSPTPATCESANIAAASPKQIYTTASACSEAEGDDDCGMAITGSVTGNYPLDHNLMPPPGITRDRDSSIFRPTPIITCEGGDADVSAMDISLENPSPSCWDGGGGLSGYNYDTPTYSSCGSLDVTPNLRRPSSGVGSHRSRIAVTSNSNRSGTDIGVSDRYIPSRATSSFNFNLWEGVGTPRGSGSSRTAYAGSNNASSGNRNTSTTNDNDDDSDDNASHPTTTAAQSQQTLLNTLLRSELLGENASPSLPSHSTAYSRASSAQNNSLPLRDGANNLRYQSPRQVFQENLFDEAVGPAAVVNSFSLMPVGSAASQRLMAAPPKRKRRISKVPFKVLDAPALQDDFYLNLVDWSSQNVLAVGLGSCVYLWSAFTSKVTKLCDLSSTEDVVTSVSWAQRGTHLAVGTNRGEVQLWDTTKCKKVRAMSGHSARVGTLAWTGPVLASGSRDRLIYLRDLRSQASFTEKLSNHKQEICGLKWSFDEPAFLASGGNDNHLHVIDSRNPSHPIHQFAEHTAAVKAIAWSPHQHGLLASGGGTADRCIRFWNTLSGAGLNKIDTGSQVCNLAWSQNCNEIVSTHGYSLNQIVIWRYPSMSKVSTLTGHTYRVLYLSMSPDGSTIVTGAGDETLRFWQVFPGPRADGKESTGGLLFPLTLGSVIR